MGVILEATAAKHSAIHTGKVVGHIVGALIVDPEKPAVASDAADIVEVRASGISRRDERNQLSGTSAGRERIQRDARDGDLLLGILGVHQ